MFNVPYTPAVKFRLCTQMALICNRIDLTRNRLRVFMHAYVTRVQQRQHNGNARYPRAIIELKMSRLKKRTKKTYAESKTESELGNIIFLKLSRIVIPKAFNGSETSISITVDAVFVCRMERKSVPNPAYQPVMISRRQ